ncbi:MAG: PQQ-binding-like beta-propeller repeat protein [Phycisphaerae bacterium]
MDIRTIASLLVLIVAPAALAADGAATRPAGDWPHWLGPNYNATSDETGLLKEWPEGGPKVLWRVAAEVGSNHPAVAGADVVFAQSDAGFTSESIVCLDLNTGRQKWKYTYPTVYDNQPVSNTNFVGWGRVGVRATPAVSGEHVFSLGTIGDAVCIDRKTGKKLWHLDLKDNNSVFIDEDGKKKRFGRIGEWKGFNMSPVAASGKAIFAPHVAPLLLALDARTGKEVWRYDEAPDKGTRPWGVMQMSTMVFQGEECILIHYNFGWRLVRISDGKLMWRQKATRRGDQYSNGTIVPLTGNYFYGAAASVHPGVYECDFAKADPQPKLLWADIEANDNIVPPAICNGYLYGFGFEKRSDAWGLGDNPHQTLSLRCTDMKTGKMKWKTKPDFTHGMSISAADGMLYVHSFQKLTLVKADPAAYVEKGRIERLHNVQYARGHEQALVDWNIPVIAHRKLIVRTPSEIICYDIADPKATPTK